ncbi:hypothetical protein JCM10212_003473 [Sporobolomyces blumeae]
MSTAADSRDPDEPTRALSEGESGRASPGYQHEDDMDELEDEEDDARSVGASSEGTGGRGEDLAPRASTSGSASHSAGSLAVEGSSSGGVPVPHKTQAAFVHKLWSMLYTPSLSRLISWSEDGKAFTVYHPTEFARTVLPQFFKHSNFASFIRQLNMYSFAKVNDALGSTVTHTNPDGSQVQAWEFQNPAFQRDRPDLLARIRRKSAKGSSVASPAGTVRRRSSIIRPSTGKSRRDDADAGLSDSEIAPRVGAAAVLNAAAAIASQPNPPSVLFGDAPPPPQQQSRKVVAGMTEFAPQAAPYETRNGQSRVKEEPAEASLSRSPSSFPRSQPSYPPPYQNPAPQRSPPSRNQPVPPQPPFYGSARPPYADDGPSRQIAMLEGQLRSLGDALFHTQQEYMASRAATYTVLGMMLGVIADLDVSDKRKDEIEACSSALAKLHPDAAPAPHTYAAPYGPSYAGGAPATWHPHPFPPNGQLSPRASTSVSGYNYYNRIPAAESYARSSRPESRAQEAGHSPLPPHPPSNFRASASTQESARPASPASAPAVGGGGGGGTASMSTGLASAYPPQAYPSPRPSWQSSNSSRTTSLPSLSSLLEGVPANGGERRAAENGAEADPADERARKKIRQ